jgi:hypothetical protein
MKQAVKHTVEARSGVQILKAYVSPRLRHARLRLLTFVGVTRMPFGWLPVGARAKSETVDGMWRRKTHHRFDGRSNYEFEPSECVRCSGEMKYWEVVTVLP